MTIDPSHTFKFIVIGATGVGKSALVRRMIEDKFSLEQNATIGVEFESTRVEIEGRGIQLQLWDTAGQERYYSIVKAYFRNAVGVLLVFDLLDRGSFEAVTMWLNDARSLCDPSAVILLIGNKSDKPEARAVTMAEVEDYIKHKRLSYLETSALNGSNVREAFLSLAKEAYRKNARATPVTTQVATEEPGCCQ
jgi:small GTP-binding protein